MLDMQAGGYGLVADVDARARSDWTDRVTVRFAYSLNDPFVVFILVGPRIWKCDVNVLIDGVQGVAGNEMIRIWPDGLGEVMLDLHPRPATKSRNDAIDAIPQDTVIDVLALPRNEMLEVTEAMATIRTRYDIEQPSDSGKSRHVELDLEAELHRILEITDQG